MTFDRHRATREFHVSRQARDRYRFDLALFGSNGNVVFADFRAARIFADRLNEGREGAWVRASDLNAMGLIDEMLHLVLATYRRQVRPTLFAELAAEIEAELGIEEFHEVLAVFVDEFPPLAVYRGEIAAADWLAGASDGTPNREVALEELVLLRLANSNPAFTPFRELFDDARLCRETAYLDCVGRVEASFAGRPGLDEPGTTLLDLLLGPVRAAPTSLEGQLAFIRSGWARHLGELVLRVLSSLDFVAEESKPSFGPGPGPVVPPDYRGLGDAPERYSPDLDWMPRVVLLAKNVHVWLNQLTERYQRPVATLDQIPDEELDRLAGWGFTALWLIGVWQRSRASERIKRMMGDAEAVASAYSLADYVVADDLGGEAAYEDLKARAGARGIRLSTDMVPNHMGIDSRWVVEHPGWFIGLDQPPFPAYTFTGPDLCEDGRVGVYLEDRYWNRSDASVVFKRLDHWTGEARYIYHGNDGTSMPWNDTAQLDYRRADVREAVIQTILHVARRSPIIRFDAAMTLAKQHYHRLWFPEPGSGGDIPSRAEHGMTRAEFDRVMPEEFWREVVDRVAAEAPDTLLLAEAFWLLEGYFVRTLGMHRVYNSAFMNMLRDERNADYRILIKSTLEYDPQILKRYVNFMSNPDERTAVDQFGTDGKYFGVATMMATLPGLPMFGHGQIEGFAEKYGMEFCRPRWQEGPNEELVGRHERQLFPILRRRGSFAEVDRFLLYDLVDENGTVDENVFAYSNEVGGARSLVVYNNRYAETRGWLRMSTAKLVRGVDGDGTRRRFSLAEGLGVPDRDDRFLAYRDLVGGLEYLRPCRRLHEEGLYLELDAYRCHAFTDLRELGDDEHGRLRKLEAALEGRGTDSVDAALAELDLRDVLAPFEDTIAPERLRQLWEARSGGVAADRAEERIGQALACLADLVSAVTRRLGRDEDPDRLLLAVRRDLDRTLRLAELAGAERHLHDDLEWWASLVGWLLVRRLGELAGRGEARERVAGWMDEWLLGRALGRSLRDVGLDPGAAARSLAAVRLLLAVDGWWQCGRGERVELGSLVGRLASDEPGRSLLGVNRWQGVDWFRSEGLAAVVDWLWTTAALGCWDDPQPSAAVDDALLRLIEAGERSGFRVADLVTAVRRE